MRRIHFALSLIAVCCLCSALAAQTTYQKPPKAVLEVLDAAASPTVSISPTRDKMLLIEASRYPSIAQLSQPMLRLAEFTSTMWMW